MTVPTPQTVETSLSVEGMDCASCVAHVEKALRGAGGVQDCRVNLARGRAVVRYVPGETTPDALAEAVNHAGYHATPEASTQPSAQAENARLQRQRAHALAWLRRAVIGGVLWLPVELTHWVLHLASAHGMPMWLVGWSALAGTLAILLVGAGFYRSAFAAARNRTTNMDTLIAMGASVAFLYSAVALLGYLAGAWSVLPDLYFMEAAGLLALISVGHYLEARARDKAGSAIRHLLDLAPPTALVKQEDGQFSERPVADVERGDQVLIRPGDRVAVDGVVVEGESDVDESMLSGESMPVGKKKGDSVSAGTSNQTGRLVARTTRVGSETALSQIIELVEHAQSAKPPVQRLADRIAAVFVPTVLAIATVTAAGWAIWGWSHGWGAGATWGMVARAACSVLIIACPCALGLAVPATLMVGIGRGAGRGILVRDIDALQQAEKIRIVVLDKTGTVTQGRPAVKALKPAPGVDETELLRLAASAEQFSEHPLAKAIVGAARARGIEPEDLQGFESIPGKGVSASIGGRRVLAGSALLLADHGITAPSGESVSSSVLVAADGQLVGELELADPVKPDSAQAIAALHRMGLRTVLLTGDRRAIAERIAGQVKIDDVRAEVRPDGKAAVIVELQKQHPVAMVGDGINDAPALAAADLGLALGSGSDIAKETGGIVLVSPSLGGIAAAIGLSRATMRKIRQNLFLAFIYNILAIPLAAFGMLNPLIAAGAMALSDVTVIGNALLLRKSRIGE